MGAQTPSQAPSSGLATRASSAVGAGATGPSASGKPGHAAASDAVPASSATKLRGSSQDTVVRQKASASAGAAPANAGPRVQKQGAKTPGRPPLTSTR